MKKAALEGDWQECPISGHIGGVVIVDDPHRPRVNGRRVALVGDKCLCEGVNATCTIITGSKTSKIDGRPVAMIGSETDHGGVIVRTGADNFTLD